MLFNQSSQQIVVSSWINHGTTYRIICICINKFVCALPNKIDLDSYLHYWVIFVFFFFS